MRSSLYHLKLLLLLFITMHGAISVPRRPGGQLYSSPGHSDWLRYRVALKLGRRFRNSLTAGLDNLVWFRTFLNITWIWNDFYGFCLVAVLSVISYIVWDHYYQNSTVLNGLRVLSSYPLQFSKLMKKAFNSILTLLNVDIYYWCD